MKQKLQNLMAKKLDSKAISLIAFIVLGGIFIFSGVGKLIKPPSLEYIWVVGFLGEGITGILKSALPFVEIAVGVFLIARLKVKWLAWVVMVLILNFIINNVWLISIGKGFESCGECFGWGIDTWPIGSLYIDLIMLGILLLGCASFVNYQKGGREIGIP